VLEENASEDSPRLENSDETYVGYGPGPVKSLRTIASNVLRVLVSTLSSHSRYVHISRSIWLISRRVNIFCATILQDLLE